MPLKKEISFKIIDHGTALYRQAVSLREAVLRKPLGLSFSEEDLALEKEQIHIAGFLGNELYATAILVPQGDKLKMRQVSIKEDSQGKGVGSILIKFCEDYAHTNGFKEIYCHARETALPFYLKNKYIPEGESFMEVGIPHVKMRKVLS